MQYDFRVGVPVGRPYPVTHVQTCQSKGRDIVERRGEATGFQAGGCLLHLVQATGCDEVQDLPDSQTEWRGTNDQGA